MALRIATLLVREGQWREAATGALRGLAESPNGFVAIRALGVLARLGDRGAAGPVR